MLALPYLNTGLGFDNKDFKTETYDGKNTCHDTVGIVTQDVPSAEIRKAYSASKTNSNSTKPAAPARKRRRALEVEDFEMAPYHKTLRIVTQTLTDLDDSIRAIVAPSYNNVHLFDFVWILSIFQGVENTPMWVGWNSKFIENRHPMQVVQYLPQLNASPTIDGVVLATMKMTLRIAAECGQKNTSISSDLAIVKKYLAIQAVESPKFNNIFVQLGIFFTYFNNLCQ